MATPSQKNVNRNGSKCMLPFCNKQVIPIESHLLNVHKLTYDAYLDLMKKPAANVAPKPNETLKTKIYDQVGVLETEAVLHAA